MVLLKKGILWYIMRACNLQFFQRPGLKLKKSHRVLGLSQLQWLKLYVEFNTKTNRSRENTDEDVEAL